MLQSNFKIEDAVIANRKFSCYFFLEGGGALKIVFPCLIYFCPHYIKDYIKIIGFYVSLFDNIILYLYRIKIFFSGLYTYMCITDIKI